MNLLVLEVEMTEIMTYRLTGRGVWGYEFFDPEKNQIGFVRNGLSSSEPVLIEGDQLVQPFRPGYDNRSRNRASGEG